MTDQGDQQTQLQVDLSNTDQQQTQQDVVAEAAAQQQYYAAAAAAGVGVGMIDPATAAAAAMAAAAGQYPAQLQQMQLIQHFWTTQMAQIESGHHDFKSYQLPLARIKKVMKTDEDIRHKMMISSEAPMLLSKACEIFVLELTLRAWAVTEDNKRRTLQRSDIATAISKTDIFDFLIDIVPREEANQQRTKRYQSSIPQTDPAMAAAAVAVDYQQREYQQFYQQPLGMTYQPDPNLVYQQQIAQEQYVQQQLSLQQSGERQTTDQQQEQQTSQSDPQQQQQQES